MPLSSFRARLSGFALVSGLAVIAAMVALVLIGSASGADHRDGPAATGAAPADITDVFAFRGPANNDNLVVAFGVNGLIAPADNAGANFSPNVTYTLHVDNTGDLQDDATVIVNFSGNPLKFTITGLGAPITGDVTPPSTDATPSAPKITTAGNIKVFAGQRDDPFFFDLVAFKHFVAGPYVPAAGLRAAADGAPANTFAGTNVTYFVMELPVTAVTGQPASNTGTIKAWVSTTNNGQRVDRMAIPAINTALIPADQKDNFNQGSPATDVASWQATAKTTIDGLRSAVDAVLTPAVGPEDNGPLGNLTSQQVAQALIPDIVTIDFSKPVQFPNGRRLTDDVIDTALQLILNRTTGITDAITSNDKPFDNTFPYLAAPNQPAASAAAAPTATPGKLPQSGGQPGSDRMDSAWIIALALAGVMLTLAGGTSLILGRRHNR